MNDRSIIQPGGPDGRGFWVDSYLPEGQIEVRGPDAPQFDAAWLRGAIYRQRWLVLAVIVAALMIGLVTTLLTKPIYEAGASVRVSPWGDYIVEGQDISQSVRSSSEISSFMATQGAVVQSRNLARVVAASLPAGLQESLLGPDIDESRPPDLSDEQWNANKLEMVAAQLQGGVQADVPFDNQIITIKYQSGDPVTAAVVVNKYSDAFVQSDMRRNIESNTYAQEYLLEQIEQVRARLEDAEKGANAFARSNGIVTQQTNSEDGAAPTITGSNLANINVTFANARANRIQAEQRWRAIANRPAAEIPQVQANPVVQGLLSNRAELASDLVDLRRRYNDQFPAIVDIKARMDLLDSQIADMGGDIKASVRNEYVVALNQEQALQAELNSITTDALVEQDQQVEYSALERQAEALRRQLEALLARFNSISTAANVKSGTITLLDSATVPGGPVSPNLMRNLILALVLGLGVAGALALIREIFVNQFRSGEELEERLGIPALGVTPYVKENEIEDHSQNNFGVLMEAYGAIRSTIDFAIPRDHAVIQFTSSQPSEGKSTTALILAELFARLGRRTLLIDGDMRKPSINHLLDIEKSKVGLAEVLLGHTDFESARVEGLHENLHILTMATVPPNPVELLSSKEFTDFIEARRNEYSLILIDSAPLLGIADAIEIARIADAIIFVVEANRTSLRQAQSALTRLRQVGGRVIGGLLTKYRSMEAGVDYDYNYRYYRYGKDS